MASNVSMFYTKKELALKESVERKKGKRVFYLESDGWNDYGYETLFELYWTDEDNKFHEIGPVKIAHKSEKITRDLLENSFSRLEENFCSLGISTNSLIFHLRGGIDYSKLNFKHKTMMKMLYHSLKNKPIESLTQEDKALIETYNTKVDFVDYDSLKQIVEVIQ